MKKIIPFAGTTGALAIALLLSFANAGQAFAATSFTRDLTLGSSGNDVTALQTLLISKGYSVPSGATGYFGAQTKAALGAYQAATGIVPASGYFGPLTRSAVNAVVEPATPTDPSTGSVLSGGEATLRNFDLVSGDDLEEGGTDTEIASATFDVKGGDIRVQRMTLELTATNSALSTQPWKYLDTIEVYNGSKKIGSVDASSKNDWDKSGNTYSIDISVDTIVKGGKSAELSIRADAQSSIDSTNLDQTFSVVVPTNGIRSVDAKGIQKYTGKDSEAATITFNGEDSGKLSLREDSNNPEASILVAETDKTSQKNDVLLFSLKNGNDADVAMNELVVRVDATFAGSSVTGEDVSNIIRRATLTLDGKSYQGTVSNTDSGTYEGLITFKKLKTVVDGNDSVNGTLSVDLYGSTGHFDPGAVLSFDVLSSDVDAEGDRSGDVSEVTGSVTGNPMTITVDSGINVGGRTNTATVNTYGDDVSKSYGTYTLKFDVTASGDDVYVPRSVAVNDSASTTAGVNVSILGDSYTGTTSAVIYGTARQYNDAYFVVRDGKTETFTVSVVLDPDAAGYYMAGLDFVQFSPVSTDFNSMQKLDLDQNKAQFRTDPLYIPN